MNLWHLAIFHAVAESGSLSAGAARLRISQPAVTRQLQELERRCGLPLFDRLPRGVRLTEAGSLLHDYAQRIFTLEREAETAISDLHQLDTGELAIGASSTIGNYLLPPLIVDFQRRYPKITLNVEISNTRNIENELLNRRLGLGLIEGPLSEPELHGQVFMQDEIVPVVGSGHTLSRSRRVDIQMLTQETLLMREPGSGTRQFVETLLERRHLHFKNHLSLGSTETIKKVAMAGVGLAWLSRLAVDSELRSGHLCMLAVPQLRIKRPLRWVRLRGRHLSPSTAAFLSLIPSVSAAAAR